MDLAIPQSLANVVLHIVYSTKRRDPVLRDGELRNQRYAYTATVLRIQVDSPAIAISGTDDHMHVLSNLSCKCAIMDVVKAAKTETSMWLKKQSAPLRDFERQADYGAFSVSKSNVAPSRQYVEHQKEHHQKMTFQDEFRELCRRHGLEMDERYVWG